MVDVRTLHAAQDNADWCDVVCRSHGIPTAISGDFWVALERSPELYPDAVTLRPGVEVKDLLSPIDGGPGCSVKDSFADLDMSGLGFDELFRASWIWRDAMPPSQTGTMWTRIETAEAFEEWRDAAGLSDILGSELWRHPSVHVLACDGPGGVGAGAIATQTRSAIGVSNVFAVSQGAEEVWAGLVHFLGTRFPSTPLVGYEHGRDLHAALANGFAETGELRMWLRPA